MMAITIYIAARQCMQSAVMSRQTGAVVVASIIRSLIGALMARSRALHAGLARPPCNTTRRTFLTYTVPCWPFAIPMPHSRTLASRRCISMKALRP